MVSELVNSEALENVIIKVEKVLEGLNLHEKEMVINQVNMRIQYTKQKIMTDNMVSEMDMPGLMTMFKKRMMDDHSEDNIL